MKGVKNLDKKDKPKYSNWKFVKDLWHFYSKYKKKFILFTFLLALASTTGIITPLILAKIIDLFIAEGTNPSVFYYYVLALLGLQIFSAVARLRAKYNLGGIRDKIQRDAKVESFNKIMQANMLWHEESMIGSKIQKLHGGEKAFNKFNNFYNNHGVSMVISFIGILGVFAFFSIKYLLLALLFITTYLFVEYQFNKRIAIKTYNANIVREKLTGKQFDISSNISTIKSLGIESASSKEISKIEEKLFKRKKERRKINNTKWISIQSIAALFFALFLFFVGKDIIQGALTAGSIVIYVSYLGRLRSMLNTISNQSDSLIEAKYGIYRMMEIYNLISPNDDPGAKPLKSWEKIIIKNLGFKYKDEPVLENLNLTIYNGEKIGIVGKSGCGKSTFFKLLLKLYVPKKGNIFFDSKPINKVNRDSIVDKISIVLQDTEVFNLSLKENITISRNNKFDKKLYKRALEVSQLDKFIKNLKNQDKTIIGEKGFRLSGGQRQRLGIARAIYKNSDIIIFDEATSNLDYETEKRVQSSLDKIKRKTIVVSAHRLTTLKNMDKILVMRKGRVIEQGTYDELIKRQGHFYKLLKQQGGWQKN